MQTDPTLLSARPADRPLIERLLDGSDSPHANLDQVFESLYVFEVGGERPGVIGLAVRETAGLVRSAVIEPSCRGMGWGTEMCNYLLAEAHKRDLTELYLLTTEYVPGADIPAASALYLFQSVSDETAVY